MMEIIKTTVILMRWKINVCCRVLTKPNVGFLKGRIKLANFWEDLLRIKGGQKSINRLEIRSGIITELPPFKNNKTSNDLF